MKYIKNWDRRWFDPLHVQPSDAYLKSVPRRYFSIAAFIEGGLGDGRVRRTWMIDDGEVHCGINISGSGPADILYALTWACMYDTGLGEDAYKIIKPIEGFESLDDYELVNAHDHPSREGDFYRGERRMGGRISW